LEKIVAIAHLVFLTAKQESTEQAARIIRSAKREFRTLPGVLDVRIHVRIGASEESKRSYGIITRFADAQSLAAFLPHPVHMDIGKEMREHFTDFAVHDFTELDG
jgi:heme-degrading monooxygenase HmoA